MCPLLLLVCSSIAIKRGYKISSKRKKVAKKQFTIAHTTYHEKLFAILVDRRH